MLATYSGIEYTSQFQSKGKVHTENIVEQCKNKKPAGQSPKSVSPCLTSKLFSDLQLLSAVLTSTSSYF